MIPCRTLLLACGVGAIGIALAGRQYSLGAVVAVLGAAQLVTSLLLVKADTALFALARAVRRLLPTLAAPAPIVVAGCCPRPTAAPRGQVTAMSLCRNNARRGPQVAA
ncbi:MAG TPA: hypothetical protein VFW65_33785 [Pseudonocardiaceae bacterium]|nr:hypothetical protein [Pseudonocardiaceae bacterium]